MFFFLSAFLCIRRLGILSLLLSSLDWILGISDSKLIEVAVAFKLLICFKLMQNGNSFSLIVFAIAHVLIAILIAFIQLQLDPCAFFTKIELLLIAFFVFLISYILYLLIVANAINKNLYLMGLGPLSVAVDVLMLPITHVGVATEVLLLRLFSFLCFGRDCN